MQPASEYVSRRTNGVRTTQLNLSQMLISRAANAVRSGYK
jgi:hypothetical protein